MRGRDERTEWFEWLPDFKRRQQNVKGEADPGRHIGEMFAETKVTLKSSPSRAPDESTHAKAFQDLFRLLVSFRPSTIRCHYRFPRDHFLNKQDVASMAIPAFLFLSP